MDRETHDLARAEAGDAKAGQGAGEDAQQLLVVAERWRDLARQAQTLSACEDRRRRGGADQPKR